MNMNDENKNDALINKALGKLKRPKNQMIAVRKLSTSMLAVFVKLPEGEEKEELREQIISAVRDA